MEERREEKKVDVKRKERKEKREYRVDEEAKAVKEVIRINWKKRKIRK